MAISERTPAEIVAPDAGHVLAALAIADAEIAA